MYFPVRPKGFDILGCFLYHLAFRNPIVTKETLMGPARKLCVLLLIAGMLPAACSVARNYMRGGMYKDLNENLTLVELAKNPKKYLDKEVVFLVRYYGKGDLPCPLGDDYVNIILADRQSYITNNKVWISKKKADILKPFKKEDTVAVRARVFRIDEVKDPNLEVLDMGPE